MTSPNDLPIEFQDYVPRAVYISKRPVIRNVDHLPITARYLYPLLSVRDFLDERLSSKVLIGKAKGLRAKLGKVRRTMKTARGSRSTRLPKIEERIEKELGMVVKSNADDDLINVEEWGELYMQLGEPTNAYRPYRYEVGKDYIVYIEAPTENGVLIAPRVMVVSEKFDDHNISDIIASWCGRELRESVEQIEAEGEDIGEE